LLYRFDAQISAQKGATMSGSLTYADAGVDIDRGDELVQAIRDDVNATAVPGVMESIGGFGALFSLKEAGHWDDPVLVSGTDGVGTKLRLAIDHGRHERVGQDLVAMCVNDIGVTGAQPLFFLDYFATGKLDVEVAATVVRGIADACSMAGCALVGGETAELPGFYGAGDYDLAGFAVGIAERSELRGPQRVNSDALLVGIPSTGLHSNGYSLGRRLYDEASEEQRRFEGCNVVDLLLEPTAIYSRLLHTLAKEDAFQAAAHITGGGLTENLPRILPQGLGAELWPERWEEPAVYRWIRSLDRVEEAELMRTFNMGLGMILVVAPDRAEALAKRAGGSIVGCLNSDPGVRFTRPSR
jgi:phosphoribosylformylglycinamidine cyclo-ligase